MFWLRILGIVFLSVGCFSVGQCYANRCIVRVRALEQAISLTEQIKQLLLQTLAPPWSLVKLAANEVRFADCDYLHRACQSEEKDFSCAWQTSLNESRLALNGDDRILLGRVGEILGRSDAQTQSCLLEQLKVRLQEEVTLARAHLPDEVRLSRTLGGFGAAVAAIIFL